MKKYFVLSKTHVNALPINLMNISKLSNKVMFKDFRFFWAFVNTHEYHKLQIISVVFGLKKNHPSACQMYNLNPIWDYYHKLLEQETHINLRYDCDIFKTFKKLLKNYALIDVCINST